MATNLNAGGRRDALVPTAPPILADGESVVAGLPTVSPVITRLSSASQAEEQAREGKKRASGRGTVANGRAMLLIHGNANSKRANSDGENERGGRGGRGSGGRVRG